MCRRSRIVEGSVFAILMEISVFSKHDLHKHNQENSQLPVQRYKLFALCKFYVLFFLCILGSTKSNDAPDGLEFMSFLNGSQQRLLDNELQKYAFRAFSHPKTGIIYDAQVPDNVSGIKVDAVRLRSGSLRSRGILYNEFELPTGIVVRPHVQRLVLVYQNLGNWSSLYYNNLEFKFVAPVLGLLAYNSSNLGISNMHELRIVATKKPIKIRFTNVVLSRGMNAMCILFYLNKTVQLTNVISPNACATFHQGHFSLVVQSLAPSPASSKEPAMISGFAPVPPTEVSNVTTTGLNSEVPEKLNTWKIALGAFVGGITVLGLTGFLGFWLFKQRQKAMIAKMEHRADQGEALQTALIGNSRAPAASGIRTQPMLENEYGTYQEK